MMIFNLDGKYCGGGGGGGLGGSCNGNSDQIGEGVEVGPAGARLTKSYSSTTVSVSIASTVQPPPSGGTTTSLVANPVVIIHQNNSISTNLTTSNSTTSNNSNTNANTNGHNNVELMMMTTREATSVETMNELKYMKGYVNVLKERFTRKSLGNEPVIVHNHNEHNYHHNHHYHQPQQQQQQQQNGYGTIQYGLNRVSSNDYSRRRSVSPFVQQASIVAKPKMNGKNGFNKDNRKLFASSDDLRHTSHQQPKTTVDRSSATPTPTPTVSAITTGSNQTTTTTSSSSSSSSSTSSFQTTRTKEDIIKCTYLNEINKDELPKPNFVSSVKNLFEKQINNCSAYSSSSSNNNLNVTHLNTSLSSPNIATRTQRITATTNSSTTLTTPTAANHLDLIDKLKTNCTVVYEHSDQAGQSQLATPSLPPKPTLTNGELLAATPLIATYQSNVYYNNNIVPTQQDTAKSTPDSTSSDALEHDLHSPTKHKTDVGREPGSGVVVHPVAVRNDTDNLTNLTNKSPTSITNIRQHANSPVVKNKPVSCVNTIKQANHLTSAVQQQQPVNNNKENNMNANSQLPPQNRTLSFKERKEIFAKKQPQQQKHQQQQQHQSSPGSEHSKRIRIEDVKLGKTTNSKNPPASPHNEYVKNSINSIYNNELNNLIDNNNNTNAKPEYSNGHSEPPQQPVVDQDEVTITQEVNTSTTTGGGVESSNLSADSILNSAQEQQKQKAKLKSKSTVKMKTFFGGEEIKDIEQLNQTRKINNNSASNRKKAPTHLDEDDDDQKTYQNVQPQTALISSSSSMDYFNFEFVGAGVKLEKSILILNGSHHSHAHAHHNHGHNVVNGQNHSPCRTESSEYSNNYSNNLSATNGKKVRTKNGSTLRVNFTDVAETYEYPSYEYLLKEMGIAADSCSSSTSSSSSSNNDYENNSTVGIRSTTSSFAQFLPGLLNDESEDTPDTPADSNDDSNLKPVDDYYENFDTLKSINKFSKLGSFTNFKPSWHNVNYELGSIENNLDTAGLSNHQHQHNNNNNHHRPNKSGKDLNNELTSSTDSLTTVSMTKDILPIKDDEVKRWSCEMDSNILF